MWSVNVLYDFTKVWWWDWSFFHPLEKVGKTPIEMTTKLEFIFVGVMYGLTCSHESNRSENDSEDPSSEAGEDDWSSEWHVFLVRFIWNGRLERVAREDNSGGLLLLLCLGSWLGCIPEGVGIGLVEGNSGSNMLVGIVAVFQVGWLVHSEKLSCSRIRDLRSVPSEGGAAKDFDHPFLRAMSAIINHSHIISTYKLGCIIPAHVKYVVSLTYICPSREWNTISPPPAPQNDPNIGWFRSFVCIKHCWSRSAWGFVWIRPKDVGITTILVPPDPHIILVWFLFRKTLSCGNWVQKFTIIHGINLVPHFRYCYVWFDKNVPNKSITYDTVFKGFQPNTLSATATETYAQTNKLWNK